MTRSLHLSKAGFKLGALRDCFDQHFQLPVEVVPLELGDSNHIARLRDCGLVRDHGDWIQISETEGEAIKLVRLSEVLTDRSIACVDLWKLAVEGFEVPALREAVEYLRTKRVRALYVELVDENAYRIREFLSNVGYFCFSIQASGHKKMLGNFQNLPMGCFCPFECPGRRNCQS